MKFEYISEDNRTIIRAIVEKKEEKHGYRAEGPFPYLDLASTEVVFEHGIKSIHPDLLGLLCMLSFYPFCKDEVTFPIPVSKYFERAFSQEILPLHEVIDGKYKATNGITIRNVDRTLEKYNGTKLSIAFGGGTDSMAVHALFPEAILIHEQARMPNNTIAPDVTSQILAEHKLKSTYFTFPNNGRRAVARPSGWVSWASCASNAVLLATDLGIGYIMTGTVLASFMLENGKKFKSPNLSQWNRAFNEIGLNFFSPVWGVTEIGTTLISHKAGLLHLTNSCPINKGGECHACFKCFRKDSVKNALGIEKYPKLHWEKYNNEKIISNLHKRPLYFGHIFRYTMPYLYHLNWIKNCVSDLPESKSWLLSHYLPVTELMPQELKNTIISRIENYLPPLENIALLESWDQTAITPLKSCKPNLMVKTTKSIGQALKRWF